MRVITIFFTLLMITMTTNCSSSRDNKNSTTTSVTIKREKNAVNKTQEKKIQLPDIRLNPEDFRLKTKLIKIENNGLQKFPIVLSEYSNPSESWNQFLLLIKNVWNLKKTSLRKDFMITHSFVFVTDRKNFINCTVTSPVFGELPLLITRWKKNLLRITVKVPVESKTTQLVFNCDKFSMKKQISLTQENIEKIRSLHSDIENHIRESKLKLKNGEEQILRILNFDEPRFDGTLGEKALWGIQSRSAMMVGAFVLIMLDWQLSRIVSSLEKPSSYKKLLLKLSLDEYNFNSRIHKRAYRIASLAVRRNRHTCNRTRKRLAKNNLPLYEINRIKRKYWKSCEIHDAASKDLKVINTLPFTVKKRKKHYLKFNH
ncbi:MAG: hypothetical protein JXR95_04820 [Deltaproteobacteria bacterium]|nr:hypothetical protein [Deltaproteobacteria bacterium]